MKCDKIDKYFTEENALPYVATSALDELVFLVENAESRLIFNIVVDIVMFHPTTGVPYLKTNLLKEEYMQYNGVFTCFGFGKMIKETLLQNAEDLTQISLPSTHVRIKCIDSNGNISWQKIITAYICSLPEAEANKMFATGKATIQPEVKLCSYSSTQYIYSTFLRSTDQLQFEVELFRCIENEEENLFVRSEIKDFPVAKHTTNIPQFSALAPIQYIDVSPSKINKNFDIGYDYYTVRAIRNGIVLHSTDFIVNNKIKFTFIYRNSFGVIDTLQAYSVSRKDIITSEILNFATKKKKFNTGIEDVYSVISSSINSLASYTMWREMLRSDFVWIYIQGKYRQIVITDVEEQEFDLSGQGEKIVKFKFIFSQNEDNLLL